MKTPPMGLVHRSGRWCLIVLALILVAARFHDLDSRPVMHDESLFAYYAFLSVKQGHYIHFPMLHGPFHYYLPILLTYELPVTIVLGTGLVLDALQRPRRVHLHAAGLAAWTGLWALWGLVPTWGPVAKVAGFLHIAPDRSMLVLGWCLVPLLVWSILGLKEHRRLGAWMGWWSACSLFQYSSAGEKVPWLAVHILLSLHLTVFWVWAPLLLRLHANWRRALGVAGAVSLMLALCNDLRLVGPRSADARERLVYNHTTVAFDSYCRSRVNAWREQTAAVPLARRKVELVGESMFPGVWYFRHCGYTFRTGPVTQVSRATDLLIADATAWAPVASRPGGEGWRATSLPLREHFNADWPTERVLPVWWRYFWFRETWHPFSTFSVTTVACPPVPP